MPPISEENKPDRSIPLDLDSSAFKFAIVASRFNADIVDKLIGGALEALEKTGTQRGDVRIFSVPGSYELPLAAKRLIDSTTIDAVIALGCVVRGQTSHFEHVSHAATEGLLRVSLDTSIPVTLGVLTVENYKQALERAGGALGNRGFDAAVAAIEIVRQLRDL